MKIFIIKERSIVQFGITKVLEDHFINHDISCYGSSDYDKFIDKQNLADLLIIDIDVDCDIFKLIHYYKMKGKKIAVWTSSLENSNLENLFDLHLEGYLYNGMEKDDLISAVDSLIKGKRYIGPSLTALLLEHYAESNTRHIPPLGLLSRREWEVLELLTKGFTNKQIASHLFISDKTVKNHVGNVLEKLEVPDRTNAVLKALKNKWFVI